MILIFVLKLYAALHLIHALNYKILQKQMIAQIVLAKILNAKINVVLIIGVEQFRNVKIK